MASIARILLTGLAAVLLAASPLHAGNDNPAPKLNRISIHRTMSKASDYVDKYAEAAMEQMRRYGIPASVTLASPISAQPFPVAQCFLRTNLPPAVSTM